MVSLLGGRRGVSFICISAYLGTAPYTAKSEDTFFLTTGKYLNAVGLRGAQAKSRRRRHLFCAPSLVEPSVGQLQN